MQEIRDWLTLNAPILVAGVVILFFVFGVGKKTSRRR